MDAGADKLGKVLAIAPQPPLIYSKPQLRRRKKGRRPVAKPGGLGFFFWEVQMKLFTYAGTVSELRRPSQPAWQSMWKIR
jgi:hypothetical protein